MKAISLLLLSIALCGCAVVNVSRNGSTMVNIENSGWYLFNFIPIASGDPENPNRFSTRMFSNSVTLENNVKMLEKAIKDEQAVAIRDLNSFIVDEHVLVILLKRHAYHTSAQLLMPGDLENTRAIGASQVIRSENSATP